MFAPGSSKPTGYGRTGNPIASVGIGVAGWLGKAGRFGVSIACAVGSGGVEIVGLALGSSSGRGLSDSVIFALAYSEPNQASKPSRVSRARVRRERRSFAR